MHKVTEIESRSIHILVCGLQQLQEQFIPYLDEWERSVMVRSGSTAAEREKMQLNTALSRDDW